MKKNKTLLEHITPLQQRYNKAYMKLQGIIDQNKKVFNELIMDDMCFGESIVETKKDRSLRRIHPMSEEAQKLRQYPLTPDECYNPDNLDKGIFVKTPLTNNWAKDSNNEQEK